ncbi:unnamed protein product, partial [Gulo gulo]
ALPSHQLCSEHFQNTDPQSCVLRQPRCCAFKSDPGGAAEHTVDSSKSPSQKMRVLLDKLSENSQIRVPGRQRRHRSN